MDRNTARETRRRKDIAYGRYDSGLVDAGPVREHLLMLGEFGLGYKRVATLAGLGITPVRNLIWGRQDPGPRKGEMQKRVSRRTAERILAVRPSVDHLAGGASVPARGAHRRVQALVARGWSLSKIARNIGWSGENFSAMMLRDSISASTYRAIADVYAALWDISPPEETHRDKIAASRARRHAVERGWAPPLAWDNIDTDAAPAAATESADEVDEIAVELACSGESVQLGKAERRAAVQLLHAERLSDARIAQRLNIADRTVLRIREELGLPGWSLTQQKAAA